MTGSLGPGFGYQVMGALCVLWMGKCRETYGRHNRSCLPGSVARGDVTPPGVGSGVAHVKQGAERQLLLESKSLGQRALLA